MAGSSTSSVIAGVSANALVTVVKFIGFGFTGSGALLSEAIHSVADTANQALLLLGLSRAKRPADATHPFGYGRDQFFWGLVSALGIFFVGAGVTMYHGIDGLVNPHAVNHTWITWLVLAIALVLEGLALVVAVRGIARDAKAAGLSFKRYVKEGKDPTIVAVLLEDGAAVFGVIIASVCIGLTELTGQVYWDAIASLLIAVLLAFVAIFLIAKNRAYLITMGVDEEVADKIKGVIAAHDSVQDVRAFKGTVVALGRYRIAAEVDFDGREIASKLLVETDLQMLHGELADPEAFERYLGTFAEEVIQTVGDEIDLIEDKIREQVPEAKHVDLEQD